ncbi:MAG: nickel-dependent hydrogenase large subunit [Paracoccaceae bacterium]
MIAEGRIIIDLGLDGEVRLHTNRMASVPALLVGRSPREVVDLLPLVFSLCARAHVVAAKGALGLAVSDADRLVVLAENAREHLLRILMSWKAKDTSALPSASVMRLVADAKLGYVENSLTSYLETHIFGLPLAEFLAFNSQDVVQWITQAKTVPARYLAEIINKNWQGLGAAPTRFLPEMPMEILASRLKNPHFSQLPDWNGQPCETGPLARQSKHPMVAAAIREFGAGLIARHLARLVDLALLPSQMLAGNSSPKAVVETARGRLVHVAQVENGMITDYAIVAPTEWNFHPNGIAVQSLAALRELDKTVLSEQACAVIRAIDPCVDFEVRVV